MREIGEEKRGGEKGTRVDEGECARDREERGRAHNYMKDTEGREGGSVCRGDKGGLGILVCI